MYNQNNFAQSDFTQSDFSQYDASGAEYALTAEEEAAVGALTGGVLIISLITALITLAIMLPSLWKMFEKAGRPGWHALVPFYSSWVLYEISGKPGWWSLFMYVPFVNIVGLVFFIIAQIELAKRFGKEGGFAALMLLVPVVAYPILGFGKARYNAAGAGAPGVGDTPYPNGAQNGYAAAPAAQPQQPSQPVNQPQAQPQQPSFQAAQPANQPQSPSQQPQTPQTAPAPQQPTQPPSQQPPSNLVQ